MKLCPLCDTAYPNHCTNCETDGASLITSRDLEPGTVIRNKYRIVRSLGRGGMGTVYLADHIMLGRQRALKFMSSDLGQDPRLLKRFRLEAQAAIELRHPNVVEVVDLDQAEDGAPYIAMEYVEGRDLRHVLNEGRLAVERSLLIARGVGQGLGVAHAKGIIHRDVKPENILIASGAGGSETPKLLDFGIAAMRENSLAMSRTQGLMLTPRYAAPEQWMGWSSDQIDGRVDLYALGGVMYEMLTGRLCFDPHDEQGWMYQHLQGERLPASRVRPELAQWAGLDALLLRMLARERDDRPRDVPEFLRELDAVQLRRSVTRVETQIDRKTSPRTGTMLAPGTVAPPEKPASKSGALRWVMVAAIALLACGAAAWGIKRFAKTGPTAGMIRENPRDGLKYAWIPPGSFEMGCSPGDQDCKPDEQPAHQVSITKGFWMGQTPVTVAAWERYQKATNAPALQNSDSLHRGSLNGAGYEDTPVILESWEQAASYCQWAGMTLPTEAQWEYAARAGKYGARYGPLDAIAWYANNSGRQPIDAVGLRRSAGESDKYQEQLAENGDFTHTVGQKQPNAWQLYDMLGNVFEWTADWYSPTYYQSAPRQDPSGPQTGDKKVLRGASWANIPAEVRVSSRTAVVPTGLFTGIGFRCAGDL